MFTVPEKECAQISWGAMFDRYGTIMVVALSELIEEMKFVNHEGWIRKVVFVKE